MNRYSWSKSAIECYERGEDCSDCTVFLILGKRCQMKTTIKTLLKTIGVPPKEEGVNKVCSSNRPTTPLDVKLNKTNEKGENLMLDKDLNIEYPDYLAATIDAFKKGYSSYGQLENATGLKKRTLAVYISNIFKIFEAEKLVNPNTEKCMREALADFIQTRLLHPNYKEKITPAIENQELSPYAVAASKPKKDDSEVIVKPEILINEPLSERENQVMTLLLEGYSPQEIAKKLTISLTTVKTHLNNIFQKKNYHSIPELLSSEYKRKNQDLQDRIDKLERQPKQVDFTTVKNNIKRDIEKLTQKLHLIEEFEKEFNM